jgi:hypothetical protein
MTISPIYLSDPFNEALVGFGKGMGCHGQEMSVERTNEGRRARWAIPRPTIL